MRLLSVEFYCSVGHLAPDIVLHGREMTKL